MDSWLDYIDSNKSQHEKHKILLDIFEDIDIVINSPGCLYWRELLTVFPDAKLLILNQHVDDWFETYRTSYSSTTPIDQTGEHQQNPKHEFSVSRDMFSKIPSYSVPFFKICAPFFAKLTLLEHSQMRLLNGAQFLHEVN